MPINSVPVRQEVTSEVLRVLMNNCAALQSINRQFEDYFSQKTPIGTTLSIKRPWRPRGRSGQQFQPEPIVQQVVPLSISYWRGGDFIFNDTDEALFLDMANFHQNYSRPLGIMLANQIDADLLAFMQAVTPNFVGTPGTLPTSLTTYNAARSQLNKLLAPEQDRTIIYTSDFEQNIIGLGSTLFNPSNVISKQYINGFVNQYAGFDIMRDEQIPAFVVGTYAGAGQVNGANQSGSSLITNNWTAASLALNPGDRFTIAGVYKVNPNGLRTPYAGAANLLQFTVTQSVVDAAGAATLSIYPAIIPGGQFQNASASPANGAAITIAGTSGATVNTAFSFQKDAFTAAFVKLHTPGNVESALGGGKEAGVPGVYIRSIKQWQSSGPFAGYETERFDAMYGFGNCYADYMSVAIYG